MKIKSVLDKKAIQLHITN